MATLFSRAIDPATGDAAFDDAARTWTGAASPELAIVQGVLTTPLGSAGRDRSYGVEGVDNAAPNAVARWRQNVLQALKPWIAAGVLREVQVAGVVRVVAGASTLYYTVTFKGRSGRVQPFSSQR